MDGDLSDQQRHFVTTYLTRAGSVADDVRDTVQLFVDDHNGKSWVVDAALDRPVRDAVLAGMAKAGISASAFQNMDAYVTHASKVVDLKKTVRNSGLTRDATLRVMMRLRGGGNPLTTPPEIAPNKTHAEYALEFTNRLKKIDGFRHPELLDKYIKCLKYLHDKSNDAFDANAKITGDTPHDRMVKFTESLTAMQLGNMLTKRETMLLQWMLGTKKESRGERGIGIKMKDDGTISGRPPFATYTKEYINEIELAGNLDTNMRHVVAWHTIRHAYNDVIKKVGKDQVFDVLGKLYAEKEGQIPDKIKLQLDGKLKQLREDGVLKGPDDPAAAGYAALYVMNSNTENLWNGDGPANQALPQVQVHAMRVLEEHIGGRTALSVNDCYGIATNLGAAAEDAESRGVGYATALFDVSMKIEQQLSELEAAGDVSDRTAPFDALPNYLRRITKATCLPAELDLIPTDGSVNPETGASEFGQVRLLGQKPSAFEAVSFLLGDDTGPDKIMAIFASLLSFNEVTD
ncbi:MAG: hypothetical protein AB3N17_10300 [Tateyamaria sp.]